jgi:hypothetical protein
MLFDQIRQKQVAIRLIWLEIRIQGKSSLRMFLKGFCLKHKKKRLNLFSILIIIKEKDN